MKVASMNLPETLLKKIEDIANKTGASKSAVVSDLLELGLQKKDALDTARELEKIRLKTDIIDALKSELDSAKSSLEADLRIQKSILQETLFSAILARKFAAHTGAKIELTQEKIDELNTETQDELEQFLQAIPPEQT